jgi:hypothetical protein
LSFSSHELAAGCLLCGELYGDLDDAAHNGRIRLLENYGTHRPNMMSSPLERPRRVAYTGPIGGGWTSSSLLFFFRVVICWSKFYKVKANFWRAERGPSPEAWAEWRLGPWVWIVATAYIYSL